MTNEEIELEINTILDSNNKQLLFDEEGIFIRDWDSSPDDEDYLISKEYDHFRGKTQ
tara:strand:- start:6022 stop:6192 length:171 start_codon:yes stop_codon:yes gene_type:complete